MAQVKQQFYSGDEVLGSPLSRFVCLAAWGTGVAFTWASGEPLHRFTPLQLGAVVLLFVGIWLVTSPRPGPLPGWTAGAVTGCALLAPLPLIPLGHDHPANWFVASSSFLLSLLLVRGNTLFAALSMGAYLAGLLLWTTIHGITLLQASFSLAIPVTVTIAGWMYYLLQRYWTLLQGQAFASLSLATASDLAAQRAEREMREEMRYIELLAHTVLLDICEGRELSPETHRQIRAVEGEIRDRIRSGYTIGRRLARAIAGARRRGVQVLLLGVDFTEVRGQLERRLIDALSQQRLEEVTIHVRSASRPGHARVTARIRANGRTELHAFHDSELSTDIPPAPRIAPQ